MSRMIETAANGNLIRGSRSSSSSPIVSHLQLDDDTLLFSDADEEEIKNVKATQLCFEAVSGLKINFFKSELIGVSAPNLSPSLGRAYGLQGV